MTHLKYAGSLAALLLLAAACSSGNGTAPVPTELSSATTSALTVDSSVATPLSSERTTTLSLTAQQTAVLTVVGTINIVGNTSFLLKSATCGFINVDFGSSTILSLQGKHLSTGLPVVVTGTGTCSTRISATQITSSANTLPISVIGTIHSVYDTYVLIQGGPSCGFLNVYYGSKAIVHGSPLVSGNVALATGYGSCADKLQATQLIVTSPATTSISGRVLAVNPTYLLIQTGTSCGMLNIYHGVSTTFTGPSPTVGSRIDAQGTGSCATQLLANTIAVPVTDPTPAPTASPAPSPVPTVAPTSTARPTAAPTSTARPTANPSPTSNPTAKPTSTASPISPTLYVSPAGNDHNSGTSASPFATIQHATDLARPGFTVNVANGTYRATPGQAGSTYVVLQSSSGTASAPITVKAENPGMAILDGQNYSTNYCYGFNIGANYVTVSGFQMQHCGEGGISNNSGGKGNVSFHNIIHDIGQTQSCETTGRDGIFSGDGVIGFESNGDTIYNIGRMPSSCSQSWLPYTNDHCIYAYGSNVTITNDTIYNCHSGWGIQVGGGSASTDGLHFKISNNIFGEMNNPGGIVGDIVTFTPSGGHEPKLYVVTGNTAKNPNGGYFINNIYYRGDPTYTVDNNTANGATNLIDWGGQSPDFGGSGNSPSH